MKFDKENFFKTPRKKTMIKLAIAAVLLFAFGFWQNKYLTVSEYTYSSENVPKGFDGFKILQISDLHNDMFGKNQSWLVEKSRECEPDIIVVTGDLIDCNRTDVEKAMEYISQAVEIAPVYYIGGNHEKRVMVLYENLLSKLEECAVTVLNDKSALISRGGDEILICGTEDIADKKLFADSEFSILLSHYPENFEEHCKLPADIIFTGHAHGGQFRLPFIGGLYAPGQGALPEYDGGIYEKDGSTMYVSRGIGNSAFPLRLFNFPELVSVTLESK